MATSLLQHPRLFFNLKSIERSCVENDEGRSNPNSARFLCSCGSTSSIATMMKAWRDSTDITQEFLAPFFLLSTDQRTYTNEVTKRNRFLKNEHNVLAVTGQLDAH
jgi:hypothetical protein